VQPTEPASEPRPKWRRLRLPGRKRWWALFLFTAHVFGAISSVHALMGTRTSQGAIAWIVSLNTLPVVAVPTYWVFGRNKFQGYVTVRQEMHTLFAEEVAEVYEDLEPFVVELAGQGGGEHAGAGLAEMPFLRGNRVELLIDGEATFDSILAGIDAAREYVLVQFYIVHDDGLGRRLRDSMTARARAGVAVWFLYDEIGSHDLPESYVQELEGAGVKVNRFHSTRGAGNRFQLNFRNHRKIVVVDGRAGWVGGHNVGDEYLGLDPDFPNWRDTHMRLDGPAVLELQLSFVEDWRWATGDMVEGRDGQPHVPAGDPRRDRAHLDRQPLLRPRRGRPLGALAGRAARRRRQGDPPRSAR
jgi:cardiolipin synthase